MNRPIIRRPKTLKEVAVEAETYQDFGMNLKDFLHEFTWAKEKKLPLLSFFEEEPPLLANLFKEGKICDAYLAATADYLCRVNSIVIPGWAFAQDRTLDEPWFSLPFPETRLLLLRDTPSAFKDKNIFTFASALNVA
jgi:hypothetical protein